MYSAPSLTSAGLLLGLSLFLGPAFEDFFARVDGKRPSGIRPPGDARSADGLIALKGRRGEVAILFGRRAPQDFFFAQHILVFGKQSRPQQRSKTSFKAQLQYAVCMT